MQQCFHCKTVLPSKSQVPNMNFCTSCGKPLTQYCPYEWQGKGHPPVHEKVMRLSPKESDGRPTAFCPKCKGLFLACSVCHRLYCLDESRCRTKDAKGNPCKGTLQEASDAFPSPTGPLDGTRTVTWNKEFPTINRELQQGATYRLGDDAWQAMVYRYGLLFGVSPHSITSLRRQDDGWAPHQSHPLLNLGSIEPRGLIVAHGHVFVLGTHHALLFALERDIVPQFDFPLEGNFEKHLVTANEWIITTADGSLLVCPFRTMHSAQEAEEMLLPADYGHITDLCADDDAVYFVTDRGRLVRFSPNAENVADRFTPLHSGHVRWQRIAARGGRLVAIGRSLETAAHLSENAQARLICLDTQDINNGEMCSINPTSVMDFLWTDNSILIPARNEHNESVIETYTITEFSRGPQTRPVPNTRPIQPGMLLLKQPGDAGGMQMLLHRADANHIVALIGVENGQPKGGQAEIRPLKKWVETLDKTAHLPQVCIADSSIVRLCCDMPGVPELILHDAPAPSAKS